VSASVTQQALEVGQWRQEIEKHEHAAALHKLERNSLTAELAAARALQASWKKNYIYVSSYYYICVFILEVPSLTPGLVRGCP
jgi:hypothetical protein